MNMAVSGFKSNTHEVMTAGCQDASMRQFINQQYHEKFRADISVNYPNLVGLLDADGNHLSAVGYRDGRTPFFCEHYIEKQLDALIYDLYGEQVARRQIVEIGNLASIGRRHTLVLLQRLWGIMQCRGFQYVVFTGTNAVVKLFDSLPYCVVARADQNAVPEDCAWGSYYSHDPTVLLARIRDYDQRFSSRPILEGQVVVHLQQGHQLP